MLRIKNIKFSSFFIGVLIVLNVLPVLAPIFMSMGWVFPAKIIYFIYSFFCHQIHWRSLHLVDHQCAWCTRDMAIWGALLVTAVLIKIFKIKSLRWYQILPFMIPIGLDGGFQTLASMFNFSGQAFIYTSTNMMRMVTGSIFGIGLAGVMMPVVQTYENITHSNTFKFWQAAIITFLIVASSYLLIIQIWKHTSPTYPPTGNFEWEVKQENPSKLVIERRKYGACPVTIDAKNATNTAEILALDCFFRE